MDQAMEFLPEENRRRRRGLGRPFSAAGKRVVIIGGGDTGADCLGNARRQGARGPPVRDPGPPADARPTSNPWPTAADVPHLLGPRGGRRAGVRGQHRVFLGDDDGNCRRCERTRSSRSDGRLREVEGHRVRAPVRARAARHGLRRPEPGPARRPRASSSTSAATWRAATTDQRRRRVRGRRHGARPEPDRVGDRRGSFGRGRGRRWLIVHGDLPAPITPEHRRAALSQPGGAALPAWRAALSPPARPCRTAPRMPP